MTDAMTDAEWDETLRAMDAALREPKCNDTREEFDEIGRYLGPCRRRAAHYYDEVLSERTTIRLLYCASCVVHDPRAIPLNPNAEAASNTP